MATSVGFPTQTMNDWAPPDKSGYMEQISKRAPYLIAAADRILWDLLEHIPVQGYQWDWLTDDLRPNVIPTGIPFEGEPTYQTTLRRNRLNNVVQMYREVLSIAEYTEIVAKANAVAGGITSEVTRQIMLLTKELMKGLERTIASLQSSVLQGHSSAAASLMAGYFASVTAGNATLGKTNTITNYAAAANQSLADFLDATTFEDAVQTAFENGAGGDMYFVATPRMIRVAGTWQGRAQTRETIGRTEHKVDNVVSKWAPQIGGEVTFQPDRSIGDCGLLFDSENLAIGVADDLRWFRGDRGSFQNQFARGRMYVTLQTNNPQALFGWTTTNTPSVAGS